MNANELRTGNWLKDRSGKILRIDWFEQDKICHRQTVEGFEVHPLTEYFEHLQPIPLTPEILEKCGLSKEVTSDGIQYGNGDISFHFDSRWWIAIDDGMFRDTVQYLHQLQNLYFALTGKELTVNF